MVSGGTELRREERVREDYIRIAIAFGLATAFHLLLFQILTFQKTKPFEVKEDYISVELVSLPHKAQTVDIVEQDAVENEDAPAPPPPPNIKPKALKPPPAAQVTITEAPDILASSKSAAPADSQNTVPLSQGTAPTPAPNQSSEDDIRMAEGLKALTADLTCLKGFSTDCADTRKDVFADFQMTETDKVYTKKYAHTGMPVAFYGMSERQIREKLNLKFAGENGIVIIPGLLALDGPLWDAMHGVNKKCEWKMAAPIIDGPFTHSGGLSGSVRHGIIKDCPDYLPAAKEDRDRRNKFNARHNE